MKRLIGMTVLALGTAAWGGTHYVVPPGTPDVVPTPGYTSWGTAATTLQEAVLAATNGCLVLVSNGTYILNSSVLITNRIVLRSFNNGAVDREGTVIDGNAAVRCFYISNTTASVEGFTITNGFAPASSFTGNGGGVYIRQAGAVSNCVVVGNVSAGSGGGLYLYGGGVVADCTIAGNTVMTNIGNGGGGIFCYYAGLVTNCLIRANEARYGGGAYMAGGSLTVGEATLANCRVEGNKLHVYMSGETGAGVFMNYKGLVSGCVIVSNTIIQYGKTGYSAGLSVGEGGVLRDSLIMYNSGGNYGGGLSTGRNRVITNCVIRNNSAMFGGGVYHSGTNSLLVDCLIVSNSDAMFAQGGISRNCLFAFNAAGIWNQSIDGGTFQNCTIVSNAAGISIGQAGQGAMTGRIENCLIYYNGNKGTNFSTTTNTVFIFTNSCTLPMPTGQYDTANITNAPLLVDVVRGNFRLDRSSPCINAGVWRPWMANAVDLDRKPRLDRSGLPDIGAYEFVPRGTMVLVR